ncbi:MAG: TonB family protein [Bryobacteraceae bacterium]
MEWKQWEGRVIDGRFHLRQYLGGSAHSVVFLTEYGQGTPRTAAIKLVPADSGKAEAWLLRREFAARLSHPGLLSIFDFGTCQLDGNSWVYAVMERSEEDLSQVIPIRPLEPAEAREMIAPVLEILAYLHAEGFVHACLTPANIMAAGDRVKISSDGLLRIGESTDDLWAPNVNGPPESRTGVTPAGDVWSLGMTLVEVLTQRAPAWDGSVTNDPSVPEQLEAPFFDIARRCLRSDPRLRCSLADISRAFEPPAPAPQALPHAVETVPIAKPAPPKAAQKRPYLLPAVLGAILGVTIFAGVILPRIRLSSAPPATASLPAAPSEQAAVQEQPAPVPAPPAVEEATPHNAEQAPDTPAPVPTPAPPEPAADNSAGTLPAGDVVDRVLPQVPPQYLATIRGRVRVGVRVRVDPSGSVVDAQLDSRAGSKYFAKVALDAARRWKFKPATDAGNSGESTQLVHFEFRTDGCEAFSDRVKR